VKLSCVGELNTSFILAASVRMGPAPDQPDFVPLISEAAKHVKIALVLGDAGFDSEKNHAICQDLEIRECVIKINRGNRGRKWPTTPLRRAMRKCFSAKKPVYHRRALIETTHSRHKRRYGSILPARSEAKQLALAQLRILLHNLAILRRAC